MQKIRDFARLNTCKTVDFSFLAAISKPIWYFQLSIHRWKALEKLNFLWNFYRFFLARFPATYAFLSAPYLWNHGTLNDLWPQIYGTKSEVRFMTVILSSSTMESDTPIKSYRYLKNRRKKGFLTFVRLYRIWCNKIKFWKNFFWAFWNTLFKIRPPWLPSVDPPPPPRHPQIGWNVS